MDLSLCLERVRQRDQAAACELVEYLYPTVIRIVRAHRTRRDAEEDIAQEVFMKLFARLGQYQGTAPLTHWVARMTLTTCLDHLRAQKCRPELRYADLLENEADAMCAALSDSGPLPGEKLTRDELVHSLLEKLSAEDRMVVVLFNLKQKTIAEICELTGWSFELVKMRVFRARRKLQQLFSSWRTWDGPSHRPARSIAIKRRTRRKTPRISQPVKPPVLIETRAAA